jgi:hypothetical protein
MTSIEYFCTCPEDTVAIATTCCVSVIDGTVVCSRSPCERRVLGAAMPAPSHARSKRGLGRTVQCGIDTPARIVWKHWCVFPFSQRWKLTTAAIAHRRPGQDHVRRLVCTNVTASTLTLHVSIVAVRSAFPSAHTHASLKRRPRPRSPQSSPSPSPSHRERRARSRSHLRRSSWCVCAP